ncbi:hypothetical protein [Comamonas testosteroni]|nr:hypothetical protein [Comamonas testosteroni]
MDARIMEETAYGRAALKKLGEVPGNFRIYSAGWLGNFSNPHGMQVSGAEFRQAKSGPNKGKLHFKIEGTDRTTYVSKAEIEAEHAADPATEGAQHG